MSLMINKPTDVKGWQPFGTMGKEMLPYNANYFNNAGGRPNLSMGMMTIVSLIMQILKQVATQAAQPTMGHQGPIMVKENANGTTTLNNSTYSNTFLSSKFEEFKNSPYYPTVETRDLRTTAWGYQGSGSTLNAFYQYILGNYPYSDASKPSPKMSALSVAPSMGAATYAAPVAGSVMLDTPVITTETLAATTADTTAATPTSTATPQDAVIEAAVTGNLSSVPVTATAVSAAPAATTDDHSGHM